MKKRVIIVHGWGGSPVEGWFPWLKTELEKRGFEVQVPAMPNPEMPRIADWVPALAAAVGTPDSQTYFVGHSIGCQTIMRYLADVPKGTKIGGLLCVAGWFSLQNLDAAEVSIAEPWVQGAIDTELVKLTTSVINAIFSPDDLWVSADNKKMFEERLGAKTFYENSPGDLHHFTGSDGVTELPKALELLLSMTATSLIGIDDVAKVEIKIGTIITAEKVQGADKLLKFTVDFGTEKRTIVSGVAQYYAPEAMVGKQVPVITNLAPRRMKGVESQGMIIYAIDESSVEGAPLRKTVMLNPEKIVPPGSPVL